MMEKFINKKLYLLLIILFLSGCNKKDYNILYYDNYTEYVLDDMIIDIVLDDKLIIENNLNIYDGTKNDNPYYKIYDSYNIKDYKKMKEIIKVIKDYNSSNWNRCNLSLYLEWIVHNYYYENDLYIERTKDVDFCQNEEILKLIKEHF